MTKTCNRCKIEKANDEFTPRYAPGRGAKIIGLRGHCKECNKKRCKEISIKNKDLYNQRGSIRRQIQYVENMSKLSKYLLSNPCVDCGESDLLVLEFDHVRGIKKDGVTELIAKGYGWATVQAEIDKCQVRCANCHRRKTIIERNTGLVKSNIILDYAKIQTQLNESKKRLRTTYTNYNPNKIEIK